ncbi:hypothetical protein PENTCL1PPCAC_17863, partial [Pristionchus entomophagus]
LQMDDDDYNVVGTYGDDPSIAYPSEDVQDENVALTRLNDIGMSRAAKRLRNELESAPSDEIYVHPIDWHMRMDVGAEEREMKRAKKEADEECIERTTLRIMQARERRAKEGWTMERKGREETGWGDENEDEASLVLSRPPIDGSSWIGVSSDDSSDRLYIRLFRNSKSMTNVDKYKRSRMRGSAVFPMEKLMTEVNLLKECREKEKRKREEKEDNENGNERMEDGLFTNRYAPTHFTHLLSPDGVNRQVVQWLRLWDECVFGRRIPDSLLEEELFSLDDGSPRRPIKRILVISGQAGLGKTTLAAVAARMVGYSVVETNASDSRTISDLERVIESAGRSTRTLDGDGRPMCVILDEVDGAPVETIRWLVKTVNANEKKKIRRPIIAICNNLYTPALRELRPVAMMVTMGETKRARLVERLSQIVDEERLSVDESALETLARLSATDIRLSLNVLQYLSLAANAKKRRVTSSEVEIAIDKVRPPNTNIFGHWSTVLEWARHLDKKGSVLPLEVRLKAVERVVMEEDGERLLTGIHHNYLSIPNLAPSTLSTVSRILSSIDQMSTIVMTTKKFVLCKYVRMEYLSLHASIATHAKATLQYPTHLQNVQLRGKQSEETLSLVRRSMVRLVSKGELILDTLPLLLSIVQPPIKTANRSLFTKQEEMIVKGIVECLRSFGLSFVPITHDGILNYLFSPPIDVLTMYSISSSHRKMLSNNQRKMIGHEVVLSSVRHSSSLHPSHYASWTSSRQIPSISTGENGEKGEKTRPMGTLALQSSHSFSMQSNVPLHFRYNNCFSNAVKRNVKMFQLLN